MPNLDPASDCACRVQDIGLYGVLKKHVVTLLVMSVFSKVQMNQELVLCMCNHLQDLGPTWLNT